MTLSPSGVCDVGAGTRLVTCEQAEQRGLDVQRCSHIHVRVHNATLKAMFSLLDLQRGVHLCTASLRQCLDELLKRCIGAAAVRLGIHGSPEVFDLSVAMTPDCVSTAVSLANTLLEEVKNEVECACRKIGGLSADQDLVQSTICQTMQGVVRLVAGRYGGKVSAVAELPDSTDTE